MPVSNKLDLKEIEACKVSFFFFSFSFLQSMLKHMKQYLIKSQGEELFQKRKSFFMDLFVFTKPNRYGQLETRTCTHVLSKRNQVDKKKKETKTTDKIDQSRHQNGKQMKNSISKEKAEITLFFMIQNKILPWHLSTIHFLEHAQPKTCILLLGIITKI